MQINFFKKYFRLQEIKEKQQLPIKKNSLPFSLKNKRLKP
jgi:hypothetical protein